jgi:hypothetical protein
MWALCVVCEKKGLKEMGKEEGLIKNLVSEVKNGKICMYFVCDVYGR